MYGVFGVLLLVELWPRTKSSRKPTPAVGKESW